MISFPSTMDRLRSRASLSVKSSRAITWLVKACVDVNAAVALAGDCRADDVYDPVRARTTRLRLAHGGERVSSLARLRDHDAECPVADDRIPVAQLGCVLDFHRNSGEALKHVLADQRRVPARAAGGDEDVVEPEELLVCHVESPELRRPLIGKEAATHAVLNRFGLLENLLE